MHGHRDGYDQDVRPGCVHGRLSRLPCGLFPDRRLHTNSTHAKLRNVSRISIIFPFLMIALSIIGLGYAPGPLLAPTTPALRAVAPLMSAADGMCAARPPAERRRARAREPSAGRSNVAARRAPRERSRVLRSFACPLARQSLTPHRFSHREGAGHETGLGQVWDPLGLADLGSPATLAWMRHAELKHGRVCMAAFVGWLVAVSGAFASRIIDIFVHSLTLNSR